MVATYLLLTATITPHAGARHNLAVLDERTRRDDYERSIRFHTERYGDRFAGVLVAENSGADLTSFVRQVPSTIASEVLNVPAADDHPFAGRGYLETMLVASTFARSRLLQEAPDARVVKVTGRYLVRNLDSVLRALDLGAQLGFNGRTLPRPWADMRVYFADRRGMTALEARADRLVEGADRPPAEESLWDLLSDIEADGLRVQRRWAVEPRFAGTRGWDGLSYDSGSQRAKWLARSLAKRLVPRLWI